MLPSVARLLCAAASPAAILAAIASGFNEYILPFNGSTTNHPIRPPKRILPAIYQPFGEATTGMVWVLKPGLEMVTLNVFPPKYLPVLLFNVTEVGVCPANTSIPASSVTRILASLGVLEIGTV